MCKSCEDCCKIKLNFYKPTPEKLIRTTQPFERLSVYFKRPLPKFSISENRYILTIVDEHSRFVWAFPCKDTSSETVLKYTMGYLQHIALQELFTAIEVMDSYQLT